MGSAMSCCAASNAVQQSPVKTSKPSKPAVAPLFISELDNKSFTDGVSKPVRASHGNSILMNYDLLTVIGEGSFSKVFKVRNKHSGKHFALKIIDKAKSLDSGLPSYKREVAILHKTDHSNVITMYEVFYSNDKAYLVLELAAGGDLFERLVVNGRFSEPLAKRTLAMVVSGVTYLHSLGITHRDLKLENVLYRTAEVESELVISDLGLGHVAQEPCGMWTTCGSVEYLAPEMMEGRDYTSKVDSWSLGVITYVVLSGHMPFSDNNRAKMYQKIKSGVVSFAEEPWFEVSSTAKEFICQLLEVDPDKRLSSAGALNHPWLLTLDY